jgi:hypothetical protein
MDFCPLSLVPSNVTGHDRVCVAVHVRVENSSGEEIELPGGTVLEAQERS